MGFGTFEYGEMRDVHEAREMVTRVVAEVCGDLEGLLLGVLMFRAERHM